MTCEDGIRGVREKHHVSTGTLGTEIKPTPLTGDWIRALITIDDWLIAAGYLRLSGLGIEFVT